MFRKASFGTLYDATKKLSGNLFWDLCETFPRAGKPNKISVSDVKDWDVAVRVGKAGRFGAIEGMECVHRSQAAGQMEAVASRSCSKHWQRRRHTAERGRGVGRSWRARAKPVAHCWQNRWHIALDCDSSTAGQASSGTRSEPVAHRVSGIA